MHRVQTTYQDDAPRFSTNFNNSIYECTKNEQESEQHAFSSMFLPKEVMIFADETAERLVASIYLWTKFNDDLIQINHDGNSWIGHG